jgi:VWFA-related protein
MNEQLRRAAPAFVVATALAAVVGHAEQQPPRFTSSVEVTSIDATVVDDRGRPIAGLGAGDFSVRIDGSPRRVVGAEWVPLATERKGAAPIAVPEGYSSNENATGGRLIVIAVDQPNIRFGANQAISRAAGAFIDRLSPSDRVAVTGFGVGAPVTPFSGDRERAKRALARMTGQKQSRRLDTTTVSVAEAQAIEHGDRTALQAAQDRECNPANFPRNPAALDQCRTEVEMQAQQLAREERGNQDQTLSGLRDLLTGLRAIDAPKTLILISEGFVLDDPAYVIDVGSLAAAARTGLYALKLEREMFDASEGRMPVDVMGDRMVMAAGLDALAGAARGAVFSVTAGGAAVFERIEAELSGYYLLAVESDAHDRDGKPHQVRLDVSRRGVTVRTRRQVVNTATEARKPRSPREAVAAGLTSPLLSSALPLRVATFALQGPEPSKVQLLIHADIGSDYAVSRPVAIGYMLFDHAGRLVDSQASDQRLTPILNGVPSALQFSAGASVPPGDYTLKFAAAEGDKAGSVEHPIHAALTEADGIAFSDLTVGGPTDVGEILRPTIGYTVTYGSVHGYVEAYGPGLDELGASFEIAADANGPALLHVTVSNRKAGAARSLFTEVIPIRQLPAGKYVLRAVMLEREKPVKTLTRAFEVAPPAVLMASAEGLGADKSADAELFLPVGDELLARPFRREDALKADTLDAFRARLAPSVKASFDAGVAFLTSADYPKAELSLKKAIQPDVDSTAALAYLAVAFAASGHDPEAASAFQTALVDGGDLPQIYEWLGETLMRTHDLNGARSIFEEAAGKWPADTRFTRPLAMLYATFGRGREAVRTLERYLADRPADADALYLAVEWLYNVRAAGGLVHTRSEDTKLAHAYADAYEKAGGPQTALVKQWTDFLDRER